MCPPLFPALKEWVRLHKKPGQFILTGSVRFTSRKAIRESLTGRIVTSELLPLTVAEITQSALPDAVLRLIECDDLNHFDLSKIHAGHYKHNVDAFHKYLTQGGLPRLCFIRDRKVKKDYFDTFINLILDRDLRQITETHLSLRTLRDFLQVIAENSLKPYSFAEVKRQLRLSAVTQKSLLYAFESIYLLRRFKIDGAKGEMILFEDQFEELDFSGGVLTPQDQQITAFYRNVRAQFIYRNGEPVDFFQYRTRGGAYIPLALRTDKGVMGFIFLEKSSLQLSEKRSAESFLRKYPRAKVIFLNDHQKEAKALSSNMLKASVYSLI